VRAARNCGSLALARARASCRVNTRGARVESVSALVGGVKTCPLTLDDESWPNAELARTIARKTIFVLHAKLGHSDVNIKTPQNRNASG
jgi:hypothetical protein